MSDYFDLVEDQLGRLVEEGAHRRRWPRVTWRPFRIPVGGLAVAISTAVAVAVAAVVLSIHRGQPSPPGGAAVNAGSIDRSLTSHFRILRAPLTAGAPLPANFADGGIAAVKRGLFQQQTDWLAEPGALRPPTVKSIELLPTLTQRTTIPGTGFTAWVIPGRHGMCWFTEGPPLANGEPSFPNPAVCVGSLQHPATTLIDGPWTDVETTGMSQSIVGLVTDRVRAVMLVTGGQTRRVPLHDGFYVSPLPMDNERLVAVTRGGSQPLYPQRVLNQPRIVGSAATLISRSSRPEIVLSGSRGLRVQLSWEMSCMTRQAAAGRTRVVGVGNLVKGYQHQATYSVPAVVPIGFPAASSDLPECNVGATATVAAHTHGIAKVAITEH